MPKTATERSTSAKRKPGRSKREGASSEPTKKPVKARKEREVVYPEIDVQLAVGKDAIGIDQAKALLGWQDESENVKFDKDDSSFRDWNGNRVRCLNNAINRPLYRQNLLVLKQDILKRRWQLNGEPIIIGKTGQILNGQHTLIALVFACQEYEKEPGRWLSCWENEPRIDKLVVFGIDESDEIVDTIDTPKPRSFSDVVFRSAFFQDIVRKDRRRLSSMVQYAVNLLWTRTGAKSDGHAPRQTHSERLDFISRHPGILRSVKHIYEENGSSDQIRKYVSLGYASALHYLMAASGTTEDTQYGFSDDAPSESMIDMSRWDKADEFWVLLAAGDQSMEPVRKVLVELIESDGLPCSCGAGVRTAVIIKAWNLWIEGGTLTTKNLALSFGTTSAGLSVLSESPTLGGIDLGEDGP